MTEHQIQQEILLAVGKMPDVRLWRQNSGKALSFDGRRVVNFGVPGCADLSGLLADGRRLEIEIKAPGGRQSAQQKAFEAMIRRFNGVYILARSVEEVMTELETALEE